MNPLPNHENTIFTSTSLSPSPPPTNSSGFAAIIAPPPAYHTYSNGPTTASASALPSSLLTPSLPGAVACSNYGGGGGAPLMWIGGGSKGNNLLNYPEAANLCNVREVLNPIRSSLNDTIHHHPNYGVSGNVVSKKSTNIMPPPPPPPQSTPEFESSGPIYPYLSPTVLSVSSYNQFNSFGYPQNPSNFHLVPPTTCNYSQNCSKDCHHIGGGAGAGAGSHQLFSSIPPMEHIRDPMLEHNYTRPFTLPLPDISRTPVVSDEAVTSIITTPTVIPGNTMTYPPKSSSSMPFMKLSPNIGNVTTSNSTNTTSINNMNTNATTTANNNNSSMIHSTATTIPLTTKKKSNVSCIKDDPSSIINATHSTSMISSSLEGISNTNMVVTHGNNSNNSIIGAPSCIMSSGINPRSINVGAATATSINSIPGIISISPGGIAATTVITGAGDSTSNVLDTPKPKKRKIVPICKELLIKPMSMGFIRNVFKFENNGMETSKKYVVYNTPDGTTLSKKQDIEEYLKNHPDHGLSIENFSFDSRLSFSTITKPSNKSSSKVSKIMVEGGGGDTSSLKDQDISINSNSVHITTNNNTGVNASMSDTTAFTSPTTTSHRRHKINDVTTASIKEKSGEKKEKCWSKTKGGSFKRKEGENDISNNSTSPSNINASSSSTAAAISKAKVSKHKRVISKYFKKLVDDSKYLDGFAAGSYRKRLPTLTKIKHLLNGNDKLSNEDIIFYGNMICVYEFIKTFHHVLKLNFEIPWILEEFALCAERMNVTDGLYFDTLKGLLEQAIVWDKFSIEISSTYYIDNIHSLKWDWLLVDEILRIYVTHKASYLMDTVLFPNSTYIDQFIQTFRIISNEFVYCMKPALKAFILRFLVDQIVASTKFSNIVNETVESVTKIRRSKFHLDSRIRLLKHKNTLKDQSNTMMKKTVSDPVTTSNSNNPVHYHHHPSHSTLAENSVSNPTASSSLPAAVVPSLPSLLDDESIASEQRGTEVILNTTVSGITETVDITAAATATANTPELHHDDDDTAATITSDTKIDHYGHNSVNISAMGVSDLEHERSVMRSTAKEASFLLRSLYLGSDRYGREYFLPKNQGFILVEGRNTASLSMNTNNDGVSPIPPSSSSPSSSSVIKPYMQPFECEQFDEWYRLVGFSLQTANTLLNPMRNKSMLLSDAEAALDVSIPSLTFSSSHTAGAAAGALSTTTTTTTTTTTSMNGGGSGGGGTNPTGSADYSNLLLAMLIDNPKFVRSIGDGDIRCFVDLYQKTFKVKKKVMTHNEFADGLWKIDNETAIAEFIKCLNQRGHREHHLFKSLNRYVDYASLRSSSESEEKQSLQQQPFAYSSSKDVLLGGVESCRERLVSDANELVINELRSLSLKMDSYLSRIGHRGGDVSMENTCEGLIRNVIEPRGLAESLSSLVSSFVTCCERKFDRPWLSKWNESLDCLPKLASSLYLLCQSLRVKIDPNSKICQICYGNLQNITIMECSSCCLSAHETCLEEPMRRHKKTKMICGECLKEANARISKVCKVCSSKAGKMVICKDCQEPFHPKCIGVSVKSNKPDPVRCEICRANAILESCKLEKDAVAGAVSPGSAAAGEATMEAAVITRSTGAEQPPPDTGPTIITKKQLKMCLNILKTLEESKDSTPFIFPVDTDVPSYYEHIKTPMDLHTIRKKIKSKSYKSVMEFRDDIMLIFHNCRTFNEDNSKIGRTGERLHKLFERAWKKANASM